MAILGSAFQIGRSALAAYQSAIAITGQNIANVGNADYTRQTGRLAALSGGMTLTGLSPGAGVGMSHLQRHIDEAIENQLRVAMAQRNTAQTTYQTLSRVEALYGELTDYDLSTQLNEFFGSFATLQTDPTEITSRDMVLAEADKIVKTLQYYRSTLTSSRDELNETAEALTREANSILEEIGNLNQQIVVAASRGNGGDSALRDRRDALLRDLAEYMDIQTRPQDNGVVNVYVGSEPLVEFNRTRGLVTQRELEDGVERLSVRFADNNGVVQLREGTLSAVVAARDEYITEQIDKLDQLARGLIYEVNRVHSTGWGLDGYSSITGAYSVNNRNAALNTPAAGLEFPIQNGAFVVNVRDEGSERSTAHLIEVDLDGSGADTTLNSLAAALNAVPGMSASVTADNRLQIDADPGFELSFSDDTSGALAALGVGVIFEGQDAATIAISDLVRDNPQLIAASLNGASANGDNAGRLAAAGMSASSLLNGLGVQSFHEQIVNQLAVTTAAAETRYEATDAVFSSLLAQRESISGVNLDEEAINLTMFERSFQGASRYLTVVDAMSSELLSLVSS